MKKILCLVIIFMFMIPLGAVSAKSYSDIIICQMDPGRTLLNCSGSIRIGSISLKAIAEQGWEVKAVYVDRFQGLSIPTYVFQK